MKKKAIRMKSAFARIPFAFAAALFAVFAAQGETYYYVGGAAPGSFAAAANWATEDGTVCSSDPDTTTAGGNTFVFTNDTEVAFNCSVSVGSRLVKRGSGMVVVYGSTSDIDLTDATLVLEAGTFAHGYFPTSAY